MRSNALPLLRMQLYMWESTDSLQLGRAFCGAKYLGIGLVGILLQEYEGYEGMIL